MIKPADNKKLAKLFKDVTTLRSYELEASGFSRPQIRQAVNEGLLERVGRGLYISGSNPEITENHSLVEVMKTIPHARICLLSALKFHDITTQNPHEVWIAIHRKDRKPKLDYPGIRVFRFSDSSLDLGLEQHTIEGIKVPVYSVAKTIVDLFRYRNKIGIDVALEAFKEGWREKRFTMRELNKFSKACKTQNIMEPYVESLLA